MKEIKINGEIKQIDENQSIADMLRGLGLEVAFVVVEEDGIIIPKAKFDERKISGQSYEIVEFVGGG